MISSIFSIIIPPLEMSTDPPQGIKKAGRII
jgi:hypothetical protein